MRMTTRRRVERSTSAGCAHRGLPPGRGEAHVSDGDTWARLNRCYITAGSNVNLLISALPALMLSHVELDDDILGSFGSVAAAPHEAGRAPVTLLDIG